MKSLLPIAVALSAAALSAQSPLTTTFAGGNGQAGNMFDIQALNGAGVQIDSFDVNLDAGTWDLEVYKLTTPGPYLPSVANAADWTLVGAATGVVSNGPGVATPLPIAVCEYILPLTTQSFYVTVTNGTSINYTNGTTTGAVFSSNADLEFFEGAGVAYPFAANFNPRVFNGNIYYSIGTNPNCGGGTFAAKTTYGAGCFEDPRMVSELWAPQSTIDLVNTDWTIVYQPSATGGNYAIIPGGIPYDGTTPAANGIDLVQGTFTSSSSATWDDASIVQTLPFSFPYPGDGSPSTTEITINSNGRIYLGNTVDASFEANGANSLLSGGIFSGELGPGLPVWAAFMTDLDPTVGGNIWYEDPSPTGGVRITWDNVFNWQDPAGPPAVANFMQLELIPGGQMNLAFGSSLGNGGSADNEGIVGFSAGGDQADLRVDWSGLSNFQSGTGAQALALDADARPVIGTTINLTVDNVPAGSVVGGIAYGTTIVNPGVTIPLIFPCEIYTSLDVINSSVAPVGSIVQPFAIPNNLALAGFNFGAMGFVLNASLPNPLQAMTSNGLDLLVGL
ncbi:MAG: hypothetical protein AB8H80_06100 [Planctomycetota bacterium]